jgi:hypothetical protein
MRKFLTRAASSAAVAAVAAFALVGPANAAVTPGPVGPIPVKFHSTLSIVEYKTVIRVGHSDVISGSLRAGPLGHETARVKDVVFLDRWYGKKLVEIRVGLTNKDGRVSFWVGPKVTARYELVFKGTRTLDRTHSGVVTVKVIP